MASLPVNRVVSRLEEAGYESVEQPFTIGGIPFAFSAMLKGRSSLDLIAVVDTISEDDPEHILGRIEGLGRALDLVDSRRPLTVIVVGPRPNLELTHALSRVARVLVAAPATGPTAQSALEDALAVLLPLVLSTDRDGPPGSWADVRERLLAAHPDAYSRAVLEASAIGTEAVSDALRELLAAPLLEVGP